MSEIVSVTGANGEFAWKLAFYVVIFKYVFNYYFNYTKSYYLKIKIKSFIY